MRLALALLLASACWAQTTPPNPVASVPQSASSTYLQTLLDPVTISLAAYDLSQVATSATAWKWTVNGQTYSVSAAKVTGIAAATTILGAYLAHRPETDTLDHHWTCSHGRLLRRYRLPASPESRDGDEMTPDLYLAARPLIQPVDVTPFGVRAEIPSRA